MAKGDVTIEGELPVSQNELRKLFCAKWAGLFQGSAVNPVSGINSSSTKMLQRLYNGETSVSEDQVLRILNSPSSYIAGGSGLVIPQASVEGVLTTYARLRSAQRGKLGVVHRCVGFRNDSSPCTGTRSGIFSGDRFCGECSLASDWPEADREQYVTMLPDWENPLDPKELPRPTSPCDDPIDLFPAATNTFSHMKKSSLGPRQSLEYLRRHLPYEVDTLANFGYRCGSPRLYRSRKMEIKMGLRDVTVLDFSWYQWSRSLKDPRSWAIVNLAIGRRRHLACWTAGNAGLSLGMLAQAANLYLPREERLHVHALYNSSEELGSAALVLKHWGCKPEAVSNPHDRLLSPSEIKGLVIDKSFGHITDSEYWDVSDGWEVVGNLMYRLIFAQVFYFLEPEIVILPAGTGNLLLGAVAAARDCAPYVKPRIIASVPKGRNVLNMVKHLKKKSPHPPVSFDDPVAPKLASTYSPLLPILDTLGDQFQVYEIDKRMQLEVGAKIYGESNELGTVAEPSALTPFAVLPLLDRNLQGARTLVVNTGYGLMRDDERSFWTDVR